MKRITTYRSGYLLLFLLLLTGGIKAQALSLNANTSPCFIPGPPNGLSVFATSAPVGTASYSWTAFGSNCTPTMSPATSTNTSTMAFYTCCGTYTVVCYALSGTSSVLGTATIAINASCAPIVTVAGAGTLVCAGNTVQLTASGALTYTWSTGSTGNVIVVSPTTSTTYTVMGANSNGCVSSAVTTVSITPNAYANFTWSQGPNGTVTFTNTTVPFTGNTYTWNYGNGNPIVNNSPTVTNTYTSNGNYTVTLMCSSICGGVTTTAQVVPITSVAGPSCAAAFTPVPLGNGAYNFLSLSPGTGSNTIYRWYFGDSFTYTATGSAGVSPPTHTYLAAGVYTVSLRIITPSCGDSTSSPITVTVCNLSSGFTTTQTALTTMSFQSTNTLTALSYTWQYGDNTFGYGPSTSHTYSNTGTYKVKLKVLVMGGSSGGCSRLDSQMVSVNACSLSTNFTHTLNANGAVLFSNISSTPPLTNHYWDFGDGVYSYTTHPTHVYSNAGTYFVTLIEMDSLHRYCRDTLVQAINVTGIPCLANANFTLVPTGTAHYWNAIPAYPWNVTSATWSWGDGIVSNALYASHLYSVASTYSICLSVTVSCGSSATYCMPYNVYRSADNSSQVINVNVVQPDMVNGIQAIERADYSFSLYPNPNDGRFTVDLGDVSNEASLSIYDVLGRTIYESPVQGGSHVISLQGVPEGVYFVRLQSGHSSSTQKIVVGK